MEKPVSSLSSPPYERWVLLERKEKKGNGYREATRVGGEGSERKP
jgi:hypothetical protein